MEAHKPMTFEALLMIWSSLLFKGCQFPVASQHSAVKFWNSTWVLYDCKEGYRHQSGDLTRHCINATWSGASPACTVDSLLPKAYLVMLIIGATLSVFLACIPYDFYRFRRRKKAARKHQERLSLMTRIAPGHAKMMTETLPVGNIMPAAQRRFGFRSLIRAFRFVTEKMKTTTGEDDAETGTSSGTAEGSAGHNGGIVTDNKGAPFSALTSNKCQEQQEARARMSAVLHIWTGRGQAARAKSLDTSDDVLPHPQQRHKRNSLISTGSSTIQAAATTAATAAAAATASCGVSLETSTDVGSISTSNSTELTGDQDDNGQQMDSDRYKAESPGVVRMPSVASGRYVQLAASIPEDTDESQDGACVGGKFKVTERKKKVVASNSLSSSPWDDLKSSRQNNDSAKVVPLTQENVAALADGNAAVSKSRDSDTTDSMQGRVDTSSDRNSLSLTDNNKLTVLGSEPLLGHPRHLPVQRQLSQDMDESDKLLDGHRNGRGFSSTGSR